MEAGDNCAQERVNQVGTANNRLLCGRSADCTSDQGIVYVEVPWQAEMDGKVWMVWQGIVKLRNNSICNVWRWVF
jgi:hypothetical protein